MNDFAIVAIVACVACVAGCSADFISLKGPADFNLSETMWSPGFSSRLEEGAEITVKRGGMTIGDNVGDNVGDGGDS